MKLYLLLGLLLVAHTWAKPQEVAEEAENEVQEDDAPEDDVPEDDVTEEDGNDVEGGYATDETTKNPCDDHHCPLGQVCDVDQDFRPICACAKACPTEDRVKVCSTTNVTFDSECELQQQKCMCQRNEEGCENRNYLHAHMDYYGACKEMEECTKEQMEDFPVRMRDWLFLVMEEMAERKELPKPAMRMAKRAEKQPKRWVLPSIWKFCELDHSHDMYVDAEELRAITAPLKAYEHCTGPFVEKCDEDNNGNIDKNEWIKCLGLEDEDTKKMDEMCEDIHLSS